MYRVHDTTIRVDVPVILEEGEDNWSAFAPGISGCVATGRDRSEVEAQMAEALAFHLTELHREALVQDYAGVTPELNAVARAA